VADEELSGTEAAEAEAAPAEEGAPPAETTETTETEQEEPEPIRQLASELGWAPKESFKGDPNEWKPASDFIRASRDINRSLSRELRGVRDQVSRMERVSSQLLSDKLAERDAYWADVQSKAVEDGDQAAVNRAVNERIKLKQSAPPTDPGPPPETHDFVQRNKAWYGVDPLATFRAQQVTEALAARGISADEQLRQAERAVRKEFPELFPPPPKPPAGVQTGAARNAAPSSRKKGFADMPAESQAMAKQYQKEHGIPLEKFAASYFADIENSRRVG
jgi:hypothetical protein